MRPFLALALTAGFLLAEDGDAILRLDGSRFAVDVTVITEGVEKVMYKRGNTPPRPVNTREISRVVYEGTTGDTAWARAVEARTAGNFAEAATQFQAIAENPAAREWELFYGSFQAGENWELTKDWAKAAAAYKPGVVKVPGHRYALDLRYRYGFALALSASAAGAEQVASDLAKAGADPAVMNSSMYSTRAAAIRAAIAGAAGDASKVRDLAQKAGAMSAKDSRETYAHFNFWLADWLRQNNKPRDAIAILDRIAVEYAGDPGKLSEVQLLRGLCLVETDPSAALVELVKIDLMPFGSEDGKCEARWHAGRLLAKEADDLAKNADSDPKKLATVTALQRAARMILSAAVDSTSSSPARVQAHELLQTIPAEVPAGLADSGTAATK